MTEQEKQDLMAKIKRLEETLGTLIIWISSSGHGALSQHETQILIEKLEGK